MLATRKVPGGKLLRLKAEIKLDKLVKPQLSGDFFLMPGEKLYELEHAMEGAPIDGLADRLAAVIEQHGITLVGITPADIEAAAKELK